MDDPTRTLFPAQQGVGPELRRWGSFDLIERVGHGGFGEVYRAFDPALQREIAVKLLLPGKGDTRHSQETTLLREARAMARVTHPNLVPIYGVDLRDGRAGFWSAFVRGKTLSALLALNGPFGPQETILIGIDLCRAVSAVHAAGLLHRDIKTGNVMREEGGRILLMDFGLTESRVNQTVAGGTPGYMAPELLAGEPATVRSDIYALGVLLYHLLTDLYPQGEHWSLLEQRPDLPASLVGVIHRAIEADPARRFATVAEMTAALAEAGGTFNTANAVPPRKNRWKAAAVAVFLVVVGAAGYEWRSGHLEPSAPPAAQQQYDAAHDLVQHYYRPQALATAIPKLEAITRQAPQFAAAFADLGRAYFLQFWQLRETRYVDPARNASLRAIAIDPNLASAHVTLGMLYTQTGKNDLAAQELDTALQIDRLNADAWAARAELYMRQGRTEEVEPALRKAMDLAPSDWRWAKQLSDFFYRTGKLDAAIAAGQDAVRLSPDNARAYNNLGLYLSLAGRLQEAETALRKAISLEPGYNRYTNLGKVERDLGNLPEAVRMDQQAIALNPSDYRAWDDLAQLYQDQKADPATIRQTLRKAIELAEALRATKPKEPYLLNDLGVLYAKVGDAAHAVPLLREAVALNPENDELLYLSGVAFELLHQRASAIEAIVGALKKGYSRDTVNRNPDLAALRKDPKYLAAVKVLR